MRTKSMKNIRNNIFKVLGMVILTIAISIGTMSFSNSDFQISKHMEIFANLLKKLHTNYVDDIKTGKLIKTGIDAMLEELDPYTVYIPESKVEDYKLMSTGSYEAIGSTIQQRGDYVQIVKIYEGFAADKAGIKPGDRILKVDDKDVKGKNTEEVSNLLKGQAGSQVELTVKRYNHEQALQIQLTREKIKPDNIPYSGVISNNTGYIKLSGFTPDASKEVRNALMEMKSENELNGLIIDLRNNGGGLLSEAVKIVGLFVPKGQIIVETRGKLDSKNKVYRTRSEPIDTTLLLAVLVNGNSASASEIVSGAIQDLDRGIIFGENTFGKGLVQNILPLSYNTRMKVTVAKYYIPSGRCIQAVDYSYDDSQSDKDSLDKIFRTKSGREVYDGDGIYPDVKVKPYSYNTISKALVSKKLIFDFVTQFYYEHDSIAPPEKFRISEKTYNEFSTFLDERDFQYKTNTEKQLEELKETAEAEHYLSTIEKQLTVLKENLHHEKSQDLIDFRDEIIKLLKMEIAGRYYYRKGEVIAGLEDDKQTLKAIELLNNSERYSNYLKPETD
ncbi:MAG: PDZ domain-containing protein [Bacteroidales bacterium]|nr:PDZ domain-containing protein [Bacteroidales bacterium]